MNIRKTSRHPQNGHFAVAIGLALALNAAIGLALLHTPTQGQRYLAAMAAGNAPATNLMAANCSRNRV